ncbi:MAG TPA: DUF5329 domain-containing protein [Steroidobacteraceae bacterium]
MRLTSACMLSFILLGFWPPADAAPPATAIQEIDYLLNFVDRSGCQFFRNGAWYDSHGAKSHLRTKYDFLVARDRIHSAEDFIEQAASNSSLSGRDYQIQCEGGPIVTSSSWLRAALIAYRTSGGQGTGSKASPTE